MTQDEQAAQIADENEAILGPIRAAQDAEPPYVVSGEQGMRELPVSVLGVLTAPDAVQPDPAPLPEPRERTEAEREQDEAYYQWTTGEGDEAEVRGNDVLTDTERQRFADRYDAGPASPGKPHAPASTWTPGPFDVWRPPRVSAWEAKGWKPPVGGGPLTFLPEQQPDYDTTEYDNRDEYLRDQRLSAAQEAAKILRERPATIGGSFSTSPVNAKAITWLAHWIYSGETPYEEALGEASA